MGNKGKGLLALLGLGAFAYWRYKNATPEQQQAIKDKVNNAKDNLNKWGGELKEKATEVAKQVQEKAQEVKNDVEQKINHG